MRAFTSILFVACLVIAGVAGARLYLDRAPEKETAVAPVDAPVQAGPVDPNRLVRVVPPLALPVPPLEPSAPPPRVDEPRLTAEREETTVVETDPPFGLEPPAEWRFIDAADLEAPPEVLERRITNKAKAILEQIGVVSVVATTGTAEDDQVDDGRNDRDR